MIQAELIFGSSISTKVYHRLCINIIPIWYASIWCMIGIISDTIHTASTSTIDSTKYHALITFFWNQECSALDSYSALSIERIFYFLIISESTSCTTTINLSNLYTAIDIFGLFIVFRLCRVYQDVGASHKGVVRCIITIDFSSCTQRAINHTTYLSTLNDDVYIAHHSSLMVACKDDGYIKSWSLVTVARCVFIIKISVYINIYGTLERHIWTTHQSIYIRLSLTSTYAYSRIVSRLNLYRKAFMSMW